MRRVDVVHRAQQRLTVGRLHVHLSVRRQVAHHRSGRTVVEDFIRGSDALVPLLIEQVEACGEGISGLPVEVILGLLVIRIVDQRQTVLQIVVDTLVNSGHRSAVVLGIERRLRLGDIGNTHIRIGIRGIVGLAEQVDQQEMAVSPAKQRLALGGLELIGGGAAQLLDGFESVVGRTDGLIQSGPDGLRSLVIGRRSDVLPTVVLLLLGIELGILQHDLIHVVRSELADYGIRIFRIGGNQHVDNLVSGIELRTVIRHLLQKIVAGGKRGDGSRKRKERNYFFLVHSRHH